LAIALPLEEDPAVISESELEQALRSPRPSFTLREKVTDLAGKGLTKADIYDSLERLVLRLRQEGREAEEDAVLDVMDSLSGWCHPDARLLPGDDSLAARGE
jgi:hypothetical protein